MARKLKNTKEECDAIKKWLKKDSNSQVTLAAALGLRSSTAIAQWLSRGRVSKWHIEQVKEICV